MLNKKRKSSPSNELSEETREELYDNKLDATLNNGIFFTDLINKNYNADIELKNLSKSIADQLKKAKSDTAREYEINLTEFVNESNFNVEAAEKILKLIKCYKLMDTAKDISAGYDQCTWDILYAAFYCANIVYRRRFDFEKLEKLWDNYNKYFRNKKSLTHLDIIRFQANLSSTNSFSDQKIYLKKADEFSQYYKENAGYLHSFGNLYASIVEFNQDTPDFCKEMIDKWGESALNAVNLAIEKDPNYAKYYCTRGRILSSKGEYDKADRDICLAIAKEDSKKSDYNVRIGEYRYHKMENKLRRQRTKMDEEHDFVKHSVVSNVQTITLFTSVIAFVLGSFTLAKDQTAFHAGLLIVTLMSCLSAVLSIFIMLLHAEDRKYTKSSAIIVLIVSIIVAIGTVIMAGVFKCLS